MAAPTEVGPKIKPRRLTRDAFLVRLRELLDEGLDPATIIERMDPVRSMSVTEAFLRTAVKDIAAALEIAHDVRNAAMVQARKDFISYTRHADEHDHVAANTRAHISQMYSDAPIQAEKLRVVQAEQQRQRSLADEAAEDWKQLQIRRAAFDQALQSYPTAFTVDERKLWEPKPVN